MSTEIEEKVVQMKFDNRQFENNIQTSLSSLARLKQSLNFTGATKGLENVSDAASKCNMSGLNRAVETIHAKFSALEIMAITALANITNSAIYAGKRIASALTIDPIKTGFQEYETLINAIQTVLANTSSKGTTLEDVNKALDELNEYADKTIYNFTEMTRNIGTFTAAGVDLDTSVQAIKGIANLAAISGSTSQQASTAMYQLSQALASGTVKLMDWNSVVNAGMGGQIFQDALKETARIHGIKIDQMIKDEGSFRETLSKGWLTSEILTETLSKFTGDLNEEQLKTMGYTKEQIKSIMEMGQMANDAATKVKTFTQLFDTLKEAAQSGWTSSWEIVVGDFEEAKALLTDVSNVIGDMIGVSAQVRNEMLQSWKDLGGRTALIDSIRNAFQGVASIIKPIKEAFREIFPPTTGQQLFNITEGLRKLTEQFKMGESTANNINRTFKGVFALLDIGVMIVKALANGVMDLVGALLPVGDGFLGITGGIGDFIVGIRDALKAGSLFNNVIGGIVAVLKVAIGWVEGFVRAISESFDKIDLSGLDTFANGVHQRFKPLEALGNTLKWVFNGIAGVVQKAIPIAAGFASLIGQAFNGLSDSITNAINFGDFSKVLDIFNTGLFGVLLIGLKKFISSLTNITDNAGDFLENVTDILDGVKGSLESYQSTLKAKTLITIAGAIAILAASLTVLSMIDSNKLALSLTAMTTMFIELFGAMAVFEKIMGSAGFKGMGKVAVGMVALSTSVLILSAALKNMSGLDWEELVVGLGGIAGMSAILVKSAEALSKTSGKVIKGSLGLIAFAGAIVILTKAVENLGRLNIGQLTKGLIGVGVLCTELVAFLKFANLDKMGILKGTGLMLLAGSMNILATAVNKFGELDTNKMKQGLIGVGIILGELAAFSIATGNAKHVISTAVSMTILGGTMVIFAEAVSRMGSMQWDQIGRGLATMAGSLTAVTLAMNFLPKGMVTKSLGMIGIATAMVILGNAVKSMGSMQWDEISRGLTVLGASMVILVGAMWLIPSALPGSAALLIMSTSLVILAQALKSMGSMQWDEIGRSLVTLLGAFVLIGGASAILAPLTPVILALAAAFALFGVATVAIGGGILALSAGLTALAVSGTAGAAALVVVVTSIIGLVPMLIQKIGEGIIAFANVITQGAPAIFNAAKVLILGFVNALIETIPTAVAGILMLLTSLLRAIADNMPEYIQVGFDILLAFLKGIRDNIGDVVEVAIDIVLNFLDALGKKWQDVVDASFELIIDFLEGLADSIKKNMPRVVTAILGLGEAIIEGLVDSLFAGINKVKETISNVGTNLINGFKETLGITTEGCQRFKDIASDIINGLINGIKDKLNNVKDAAVELGSTIVNSVKNFLGIASPSKVMKNEVGKYIVQGIAEGIKSDMSAEEAATKKAQNIINAFKEELDKFSLDTTTADLEYELWETLKGSSATETEKATMQTQLLTKKLQLQAEKVQLAQGEYQVMIDQFGKESEKTQEAYNKFLQEQISLAKLTNEITEAQKEEASRQQEARKTYYDYIIENGKLVGQAGLTYEDIQKSATAISGYDPTVMTENMTEDVQEAVSLAMGTVQTAYSENAESTFGSLTNNFANWGASYATALSDALRTKSSLVVDATTTMLNECTNKLKAAHYSWVEVGSYLVDGLIKGIEENIARAKEAAAELASITMESAKEEFSINSPSKKFEKMGMQVDRGLAVGISKYTKISEMAAGELGKNTIEGFRSSIKRISDVINSDVDTTPTIQPVIDMSNIKEGEKQINSIFSKNKSINLDSSVNRVSAVSRDMRNGMSDNIKTNNDNSGIKGTSFNFTQNNYSPKSLSQIDIYRQTKNQFSAFKGMVSNI